MAATLADPALRAQHVADIVNLVVANGYDGIDLDYEVFAFSDGSSSWAATQPNWTAFVTELGAALKAQGKLLAVTIPPPCNTAGACGPQQRLLGLQHRRHRAGRRPHPDHGVRLPRQRHRSDRADAVGALDRAVQRVGHGPGEAADRRAHLRPRLDPAGRQAAPADGHLPHGQGIGRLPIADRHGVGDRPRHPRPPGVRRRHRARTSSGRSRTRRTGSTTTRR